MNSPYWFEIAVICGLTAVGNIVMGHFEERTPKWRRVGKIVLFCVLSVAISAAFGRPAFFAFLGIMITAVLVIHAWWLPRNGINGWTAEPRDRYYKLRGWQRSPTCDTEMQQHSKIPVGPESTPGSGHP